MGSIRYSYNYYWISILYEFVTYFKIFNGSLENIIKYINYIDI
jgi:hypothetical protein